MPEIFEGDAWKHAEDAADRHLTRAELQARLDDSYAAGRINRETWIAETDYLSEPPVPINW